MIMIAFSPSEGEGMEDAALRTRGPWAAESVFEGLSRCAAEISDENGARGVKRCLDESVEPDGAWKTGEEKEV
jgi:hypothetical protein